MVKFVASATQFQNVGKSSGSSTGSRARVDSTGSGGGHLSESGSVGGGGSTAGVGESGRGGNERHVQVWASILIEVFEVSNRQFPELIDELVPQIVSLMEGTDSFHTTMILTHLLFVALLRGKQTEGEEATYMANMLCPASAAAHKDHHNEELAAALAATLGMAPGSVEVEESDGEGPTEEEELAKTPLRRILALSQQDRPSGSFVAALVIGQLSQTSLGRVGLERCGPGYILECLPQITRDVNRLVASAHGRHTLKPELSRFQTMKNDDFFKLTQVSAPALNQSAGFFQLKPPSINS